MNKQDTSWNNNADQYDKQVGETGDLYHKTYLNPVIEKMLGNVNQKHILDLACGQGYFSRLLAKNGAFVTGIDISDRMIELANQYENKEPLGIKYHKQDSSNLFELEENSFDVIVSNMAFHDIRTIAETIKECHRVLKTNGQLIFSILNPITDIVIRDKSEKLIFNKMHIYRTETEKKQNNMNSFYHRSIGFYLELLFSSNFLVSDFREIYTKHCDGEEIRDSLMQKYKQEFPSFLIISCDKK